MKHVLTLLLLVLQSIGLPAQEFGTHWISHPQPDSTSQIWFRHTYTAPSRPLRGFITITTTGLYKLYINEIEVGSSPLPQQYGPNTAQATAASYNVTRYLRTDSNTIAVWYSPASTHPETRQVSVVFSGQYINGNHFAHYSNADWLCRHSGGQLLPGGGELFDATLSNDYWNANDFDPACWLGAVGTKAATAPAALHVHSFYTEEKTTNIRPPKYFDVEHDSLWFDFGEGFKGTVRLTLRDAHPGEHINIGGLEYICSGRMDEQAYRRFTAPYCRKVLICGDGWFRREQIQQVEALQHTNVWHHSYLY